MLIRSFPAGAFGTNCYAVASGPGQECVVVDPGMDAVEPLGRMLADDGLKPVAVVLTHVRDPGNAGTVLRGADAFGAAAVLVSAASVDVYNPKVVRATVGSLFHLPVAVGIPVEELLVACRERGVRLLAADGRMSFTDLGKATGLSTSAVHQRVKRLEKRGVITGYGAGIDHEELGLALTAFVSITPIDPSQPDDCAARLEHVPEIESCWSVAGEESYVLKVRTTSPSALEDLLARIRAAANVSTRTTIVLSTYYENRPVTGE